MDKDPPLYHLDGSLCECECHKPGPVIMHMFACCRYPSPEAAKEMRETMDADIARAKARALDKETAQ